MDTNNCWDVFLTSGDPLAYLIYKKSEKSDKTKDKPPETNNINNFS